MAQEYHIREARSGDAPVIAEFNRRLAWETEHRRLEEGTLLAGVQAVLLDRSKGVYFVADAGGSVVGQCSITYEWSDWRNGNFWWLQSVYVESGWRGRGVFRSLYEHVREAAVQQGVIGMRLYVEGENETAQEAYRRRGMERTGYQVFEVGWA